MLRAHGDAVMMEVRQIRASDDKMGPDRGRKGVEGGDEDRREGGWKAGDILLHGSGELIEIHVKARARLEAARLLQQADT